MTHHSELNAFETERYARQLRLGDFGIDAQIKLKSATVFISRVGGVGGAVAAVLARAGIGRLILAHGGKVTPEYLNRWPLAMTDDVGRPCIEAVSERLAEINPAVEVVRHPHSVTGETISAMAGGAAVIVDAAPLFEERYAMNAEAVRTRTPLVMAAMYATEGYVSSFLPGQTPCMRCLYPESPPYWTDIQSFPALGPGPNLVGSMAAMETIKLITGFGQPLTNTLCFFDLSDTSFRHLRIDRRDDCADCGHIH